MIERFNFYDIYGYLIPGALLIAVLWFPHAVWQDIAPSEEISAALAMVVAAYVCGHILQIVAARALPSSELVHGKDRPPSDLLLSETHRRAFPAEFRRKVIDTIRYRLAIDATIEKNRDAAFSVAIA